MQKMLKLDGKMKTFHQYLEEMNDLGISGVPPEESLIRIAKIAAQDHRDELLNFFHTLASNDHRIRQELDNINRNNSNRPQRLKDKGKTPDNKDEVVPHASDGLSGLEPGEQS